LEYGWPGNVRELRNFCERVAAICDEGSPSVELAASLLDSGAVDVRPIASGSPAVSSRKQNSAPPDMRYGRSIEAMLAALGECGSVAFAAHELGIHRTTLWRRLKKAGIDWRERSLDTTAADSFK
jgi:transcriptional regulator of acetoin/glycerol metabolism